MKILFLKFLLLSFTFYACKSENVDSQTVSLAKLAKDSRYKSMPLLDTEWKLIGFGNTKNNMIQLAQSYNDSSYVIAFKSDNQISGRTSTNKATGIYTTLSKDKINISVFGAMTMINEIYDGERMIQAMRKVVDYRITDKGLLLYYEDSMFLLFRPTSIDN